MIVTVGHQKTTISYPDIDHRYRSLDLRYRIAETTISKSNNFDIVGIRYRRNYDTEGKNFDIGDKRYRRNFDIVGSKLRYPYHDITISKFLRYRPRYRPRYRRSCQCMRSPPRIAGCWPLAQYQTRIAVHIFYCGSLREAASIPPVPIPAPPAFPAHIARLRLVQAVSHCCSVLWDRRFKCFKPHCQPQTRLSGTARDESPDSRNVVQFPFSVSCMHSLVSNIHHALVTPATTDDAVIVQGEQASLPQVP